MAKRHAKSNPLDAYEEFAEGMKDLDEKHDQLPDSANSHLFQTSRLNDSELSFLGEDLDPLMDPGADLGLNETERAMLRQQRHFNFVWSWRAVLFSAMISFVDFVLLIVEFALNKGWNRKTFWVNINTDVLIRLGAKSTILIQQGQVHRLVLPMFLHVGLLHFIVNILTQVMLSAQIEASLGFWRTAFVYIVSGIGGNLASAIFLPRLVEVGASSSLFGLVGVYFVDIIVNWSVHTNRRRNLIILIVTTVVSFALGFFPHIDNFAHLGGFITGLIASAIIMPSLEIPSMLPSKARKQKRRKFIRIATASVILACLIGIGLAILLSGINLIGWCPFCEWISCPPFYPACKADRGGQEPE